MFDSSSPSSPSIRCTFYIPSTNAFTSVTKLWITPTILRKRHHHTDINRQLPPPTKPHANTPTNIRHQKTPILLRRRRSLSGPSMIRLQMRLDNNDDPSKRSRMNIDKTAITTTIPISTDVNVDSNDNTKTQLILEASQTDRPILSFVLDSYWGSRIILLICAAIYSTNFALGTLMNETLPPSAVTACRMTFAAITLLPFLLQIQMSLLPRAIFTGVCAAVGYVTQSMALSDTDPARVSFLGAATVLWLPILESTIDKVPMSITDAPQTWMAAVLCILGVGILELYDPSATATTAITSGIHTGDLLALVQAIGFGTGAFLSSKLVREQPDQVLSITSVLIATTAILSWIWCILVGSTSSLMTLIQSDPIHTNLPLVFSILWTGIVSTSINYVIEIAALGRVPPAEASVLLASEPIWAAVFAAVVLGNTSLGVNDYIGGSCIVAACLVNALLKPQDILNLLPGNNKQNDVATIEDSKNKQE